MVQEDKPLSDDNEGSNKASVVKRISAPALGGIRRILGRKSLLFFYLFAIILPFALDHLVEIAENSFGIDTEKTDWVKPGYLYQRITTAGYRKPRSHFVRLVIFNESKEPPGIGHSCSVRSLYAKALLAISRTHPALIVLDEMFDRDACKEEPDATDTIQLQEAVKEITASGIPMVFGMDSWNRDSPEVSDVQNDKRLAYDELIQAPLLEFLDGTPSKSGLYYGHVRVESDTRLIPLSWQTFVSKDDFKAGKQPTEVPTLALQTARIYDLSPAFQSKLNALDQSEHDPYTSFIGESGFSKYELLDLLCGSKETAATIPWKTCSPSEFGVNDLRGHIVLVGSLEEDDQFDTVVGVVPGYLLHANYIESLLDDRFFSSVPFWIQVIASLALFGIIEWIFRQQSAFPMRALGWAIFTIAMSWLVCYVLALAFGYYLYLWIPGTVVVLAEFLHLLADGMTKRGATDTIAAV